MKIIYKKDGILYILVPTQEALDIYGIDAVAKKDVPAGVEYWFIEDSEIPTDFAFRDAWDINTDKIHDGIGSKSNEFEVIV